MGTLPSPDTPTFHSHTVTLANCICLQIAVQAVSRKYPNGKLQQEEKKYTHDKMLSEFPHLKRFVAKQQKRQKNERKNPHTTHKLLN